MDNFMIELPGLLTTCLSKSGLKIWGGVSMSDNEATMDEKTGDEAIEEFNDGLRKLLGQLTEKK
jgi:hypothetical protein